MHFLLLTYSLYNKETATHLFKWNELQYHPFTIDPIVNCWVSLWPLGTQTHLSSINGWLHGLQYISNSKFSISLSLPLLLYLALTMPLFCSHYLGHSGCDDSAMIAIAIHFHLINIINELILYWIIVGNF